MPVDGFKKAFARAYLAEDQPRRYEVRKGDCGWLFYEDLPQLGKDRLALSTMIPAGSYLQFGNEAVSEAIIIDRQHLKGVMLRPIDVWMSEEDVKARYEFSEEGEWEYQTSEDGQHTEIVQTQTGEQLKVPLTSQICFLGTFCPNGFFAVGIRRQAPPQESTDAMRAANDFTEATYCTIVFGGGKWCLFLPGAGQPALFEHLDTAPRLPGFTGYWPDVWVPRPWTEGQLGTVDANGLAQQGKQYSIGVIGHAVAVSESRFEDDFAYYVVEDRAQPVVPAGSIVVTFWPGQAAIWLNPLQFRAAKLWRYPFWAETVALDRIGYQVWGEQLPFPYVKDGTGIHFTPAAYGEGGLQWTLEIDPQEVADEEEPLRSYTTPFVESITLWQEPIVSDNGALAWEELPYTYQVDNAAELGQSTAGSYSLTVDNRMALSPSAQMGGKPPTVLLRPGRMIKLEGGRQYWDGSEDSAQLGQYFVLSAPRNPMTAQASMTDLLGMLALTKWRHGSLCLRGFYAKYAIEFLLQLEGFAPDWYDIEDLGAVLYGGLNPDNETWSYDEGTVVADILAEIARYGMKNGVFYYDGATNKLRTGCPYCRAKRTAEDWASHQDNGWNSSGCLAADALRNEGGVDLVLVAGQAGVDPEYQSSYEIAEYLEVDEAVLGEGEYANMVQVVGQAADGRKLGAWIRNDDAIWRPDSPDIDYGPLLGRTYVGWPILRSEEMRHATTQAEVNARAVELAQESFPWALMIRQLTMPFHHRIQPGWVIRIEGGKAADAAGRKFRVTSVQHDIRGQKTQLTAREMVGHNA